MCVWLLITHRLLWSFLTAIILLTAIKKALRIPTGNSSHKKQSISGEQTTTDETGLFSGTHTGISFLHLDSFKTPVSQEAARCPPHHFSGKVESWPPNWSLNTLRCGSLSRKGGLGRPSGLHSKCLMVETHLFRLTLGNITTLHNSAFLGKSFQIINEQMSSFGILYTPDIFLPALDPSKLSVSQGSLSVT